MSLLALVALSGPVPSAFGQDELAPPSELKKLSFEDLLSLEVTSVSKRPESLWRAASAIQVITGEEIVRSGATTLPEALRLAGNLQVAQVNAHDWAITARGFNGAPLSNNSLADKLLVMIDGRTVYTPLFGGVFWDVQNVALENVDRIEVISGPGGTLWGANAVNGVINIVTKSARATPGFYASAAKGSQVRGDGALRYGGALGTKAHYRVDVQRIEREGSERADGFGLADDWELAQGGFRIDYDHSDHTSVMVVGDLYDGIEGRPTTANMDGQSVLGRWTHTASEAVELTLQAYFDRTWRRLGVSGFSDELRTFDLEFQNRLVVGSRNTLVWGAGGRWMQDRVGNTLTASMVPAERDLGLTSAFVQDELVVVPGRMNLTVGSKFENNEYSGFELQPTVRVLVTPSARQSIWGAVSRAVRAPSRFDVDFVTTGLIGNPDFQAEEVIAYELGARVRAGERASISLAGFVNQYDDLRSINLNPNPPPGLWFANGQRAETRGIEATVTLEPATGWRLRGCYAHLYERLWTSEPGVLPGSDALEAIDPAHQFVVQSLFDLPGRASFDVVARGADELESMLMPRVPAYWTLDARLAIARDAFEIALVGQNLVEDRHKEFGVYIPRSAYGRVTWRY